VKEQSRDARGTAFVDHLRRDTRHAARGWRRDWRFTAAAVLILGLGIGVNTAIFSVINAVLFRRQTVVNPTRSWTSTRTRPVVRHRAIRTRPISTWRRIPTSLPSSAVTFIPHPVTYPTAGPAAGDRGEHIGVVLSVLGLRPALGRWFHEAEDALNAPPWPSSATALDDAVCLRSRRVGRIIRIEGTPVTVVGVAPAESRRVDELRAHTDFWMPLKTLAAFGSTAQMFESRRRRAGLHGQGSLRPGVTVRRRRRR
jgi:hypothetical protein